MMDDRLSDAAGVVPSTFALVGAAGFSCAATQTISAAVVRDRWAHGGVRRWDDHVGKPGRLIAVAFLDDQRMAGQGVPRTGAASSRGVQDKASTCASLPAVRFESVRERCPGVAPVVGVGSVALWP